MLGELWRFVAIGLGDFISSVVVRDLRLIGDTTTAKGLKVKAALDTERYESGIKVTDRELAAVQIKRDDFHGEWNYSVSPNKKFA